MMNKKIFGVIFLIFILTVSTVQAMPLEEEKTYEQQTYDLIDEYIEYLPENIDISEYNYLYVTIGPIGPIKKLISKVEIKGNATTSIPIIKMLMKRGIFKFISPKLPCLVPFPNNDINLNITYKLPLRRRAKYGYSTYYMKLTDENIDFNQSKLINGTYLHNIRHSLQVTGLRGTFVYLKTGLYKRPTIFKIQDKRIFRPVFWPAHFAFVGVCKDIEELPMGIIPK